MSELANEKNVTKKVEDQLENIKELYNRTTRESSKVVTDLRQEQEKYRILTDNVNSSVNKSDQELYNLRRENKELRIKIEEVEEENEEFRSKLNEKDDAARKNEEESTLILIFKISFNNASVFL